MEVVLNKNPAQSPDSEQTQPEVVLRRNDFRTSTKLKALMDNLRKPADLFSIMILAWLT